ncbi:chaperonin GroEL [Myxococcus sp. SDU36]|uniref:chaperonin GroEL n=1 Tax=Myxococcus sp. SDU36 TaxID=2831967 RepID=UPI002543A232|nr:chaperonin GroEL [Myxococcus sp. SDU36]WIG97912.1 chaperonin GroEL [Myxococcus sp. SDU36]
MTSQLSFGNEARLQLLRGVNALADAVAVTLGPRGGAVALRRASGPPLLTRDGNAVAREIELPNAFEELGVRTVRQVAAHVASVTGDGATTAILLARAIYREGYKYVAAGYDPRRVAVGIEAGVASAVAQLRQLARRVERLHALNHVASVAAHGDEALGLVVAQALARLGPDAVVVTSEGQEPGVRLEYQDGPQLVGEVAFIRVPSECGGSDVCMEDAAVLVLGEVLANPEQLLPLVSKLKGDRQPLLLVAPEFSAAVLRALAVGRIGGGRGLLAVRLPQGEDSSDALEDVAAATGGRVVSTDGGLPLASVSEKDLGVAARLTVLKERIHLLVTGEALESCRRRERLVRSVLLAAPVEAQPRLQKRLASFVDKAAIIRVGAATATEARARWECLQAAVRAGRAALEEGVVPGGGVALFRAAQALARARLAGPEEEAGLHAVAVALEAPLGQLAANAGQAPGVIIEKVRAGEGAWGFNARSGECEDLEEVGLFDAAKTLRLALEGAARVASLLLNAGGLVTGRVPVS